MTTKLPLQPVYIFDIDGTMADHSHRLHHIVDREVGKKDWAAFHAGLVFDPPMVTCHLARSLILAHVPIIFLTGRMEHSRKATQEWLAKHLDWGIPAMFNGFKYLERAQPQWGPSGPFPWLLMRPEGDKRDDTVVKGEWLDRIEAYFDAKMPTYKVTMAFEDRPRICELWKSRGLCVAKIGDWTEEKQAPAAEAWANAGPSTENITVEGKPPMPTEGGNPIRVNLTCDGR